MRPEFLNRIDDIIVFNPLHNKEKIKRIVDIKLEPVYKILSGRGITLELAQKYIQDPLALKLLDGSLKEGAKVVADLDADVHNNIIFEEKAPKKRLTPDPFFMRKKRLTPFL